jgi:hypothetical protein
VLRKEKVETEAGTFDAWKIQPVMREKETEDDRNKGKLFLWFSDDARRLPVIAPHGPPHRLGHRPPQVREDTLKLGGFSI